MTYQIHLVYRSLYHISISYPLNKFDNLFIGNGLIFSIKSWKRQPIIIIINFCSMTNIHMLMFTWGKNNYSSICLSWSVKWTSRHVKFVAGKICIRCDTEATILKKFNALFHSTFFLKKKNWYFIIYLHHTIR